MIQRVTVMADKPVGVAAPRWAPHVGKAIRGFHTACADLTPARAFVVYAGDERFPMARSVEAIGVVELANMLAERADAP